MQLHTLNIGKQKYPRPRVGRGGKRGTTSGRGTKGQRSRAGHRIRPAERDYVQRLPKLRGIKNPRGATPSRVILNLDDLERLAVRGTVSAQTLRAAGLTHRGKRGGSVKILGRGKLTSALSIKGVSVSGEAKKKIVAAGGRVIANNANDSK